MTADSRRRVLVVLGTRPEGIKLAPVIIAAKKRADLDVRVASTGQHATMLKSVLDVFDVTPDDDLAVMRPNQKLGELSAAVLQKLQPLVEEYRPDAVVVQGDTTTSFAAAFCAFCNRVPVAHVEAGLRTHDLGAPWPEEANRQLTGRIAWRHYAPTNASRDALLAEQTDPSSVLVTGNTSIDALLLTRDRLKENTDLSAKARAGLPFLSRGKPFILVTGHRRESFGQGFNRICEALRRIAETSDMDIAYPVHLNPNVKGPVEEKLAGLENVHLIEPLDYLRFVYLMEQCAFIITDSGGVQEEAPSFHKPVLVMREKTEREEAVEAGLARLVGTDTDRIVEEAQAIIRGEGCWEHIGDVANPFGDGQTAQRIAQDLATAEFPYWKSV